MDPRTYCEQALKTRRSETTLLDDPIERSQLQILLAHYARHASSEVEFVRDLAGLARSGDQTGRRRLAKAARQLLEEWQAHSRAVATS